MSTKVAAPVKSARRKTPAPPTAKVSSPISTQSIKRLKEMFRVLADESRIKILLALGAEEELHVTALCDLLGSPGKSASQPAVSHHLTLMRMVGLVGFRRDGKHNYYHLASAHVRDLFEQFFADSGNGHKAIQFDDFALTFKRK